MKQLPVIINSPHQKNKNNINYDIYIGKFKG